MRDNNGNPLQGVNVAISATNEALTNGYFASTTSNANGGFSIGAIPITSASGAVIPSFKVRFVRQGFVTRVVGNVNVNANQTTQVQTALTPATTTGQVRFEDDVDDREPLPFTSGGFNQAPVWRFEEFDLSPFAGSKFACASSLIPAIDSTTDSEVGLLTTFA